MTSAAYDEEPLGRIEWMLRIDQLEAERLRRQRQNGGPGRGDAGPA